MNALAGMETAHVQHRVYLFDSFQLDVTRRKLLSSSGVVLPLNSRAMEALLLLVANAGEVVERRRLVQAIWPQTVVEDNNLNQCILAIRKALGEAYGSNRFVMTVPGRGFCFVCPVRLKIQESSEDTTQHPAIHQAWWRGPAFWLGLACGAAIATLLLLVLR
ncbi:MAG TPA: winged helix-turn-helix domain-containing protein [Steroidobacteraceae bacterium]|nr:winged helix-turn-helix domain-containing protein [Steroidobacteraceae bacterium]